MSIYIYIYIYRPLPTFWTVAIYLPYSRLPDTPELASSRAICGCSSFSDRQCRLMYFRPTAIAVSVNAIFCSKHLVVPIPPVKIVLIFQLETLDLLTPQAD